MNSNGEVFALDLSALSRLHAVVLQLLDPVFCENISSSVCCTVFGSWLPLPLSRAGSVFVFKVFSNVGPITLKGVNAVF